MHEVVAGEQENLLNSGVVSGGDAFREGVVGSGVGVPGGASAERTAAGMGFKHMVAASLVDELDDAEELEGSRDVYDAAEGGRAVRRKLASRKAAKAAERAGGQGAVPDPAGKAKSAADPCRQAAEMRGSPTVRRERPRRPRTRPQALPWRCRPRQSERRWLALAPPQPPQPQRPREPRAPQGQSPAPAYP